MTYPDPAAPTTPIPMGSPPIKDDQPGSTTDVAKQQAQDVKDTASGAAADVGHAAKDQAATVVSEAQTQAKNLLNQAQHEMTEQASTQQQRAAGGLRSLGDELRSMADRSETDGPATSLAHEAATRATTLADWLEDREPGDVLNEVKRFARRRPAAFLALAAGAGLLTARLTRGLTGDSDDAGANAATRSGTPAVPHRTEAGPVAPLAGGPNLTTPVAGDLTTPEAPNIDPAIVPPVAGETPYPGPPSASGGAVGGYER